MIELSLLNKTTNYHDREIIFFLNPTNMTKFCSVADEKTVFLDIWRTFQVIEMNE